MANPSVQSLLRDDDAGAVDVVVDEIGVEAGEMVDVIEAVSEIGSDLHPRNPSGEIGEARVQRVSQAISEINTANEFIDEVNVVTGDGSAEEFNQAAMVAPADNGEAISELR